MSPRLQSGDLAFVSHIPIDLASGGGVYARSIFDLLNSVWEGGSVKFVGPDRPVRPSKLRSVMWSMMSSRASKVEFAARTGLSSAISKTDLDQNVVICLNSPDSLPLVEEKVTGPRFILVSHNIESELFRKQVARLPSPLRQLMAKDARKYAEVENRAVQNASLIISISDRDAAAIRAQKPNAEVVHIPPVFQEQPKTRGHLEPSGTLRLGFIGRMSWWPNREAFEWLKEVLSPMPKGREVHLFGRGTDELSIPGEGWTTHGFVEDSNELWDETHVALCPMNSGGGVNIKLVDALSRGVPVLTTSFGMRGLGLPTSDRPGLRVVDGEAEWRDFIQSDGLEKLAAETSDPALASHFLADTYANRLRIALKDASLIK